MRGLAVAVVLLVAFASGTAAAGDGASVITIEPRESTVDPGETVTLDVELADHGDLHENGVGEFALEVKWDEPLELEDVEQTTWLEASDGDHTADVTVENDSVRFTESLEDASDGVRGSGPVGTITLRVPADAEPSTATVSFDETTVVLVTDWPQGTVEREGTILVDGGGDEEGDDDTPDGITLADDADPGADDGATDADDTDASPGTGVLAVTLAVLVALGIARRRS